MARCEFAGGELVSGGIHIEKRERTPCVPIAAISGYDPAGTLVLPEAYRPCPTAGTDKECGLATAARQAHTNNTIITRTTMVTLFEEYTARNSR